MVEKVRMCTWKVINFYSRIYGHFKCIDDSVARKKQFSLAEFVFFLFLSSASHQHACILHADCILSWWCICTTYFPSLSTQWHICM